MSQIYECKTLNIDEITTKYEYIYKDDIEKSRNFFERFRTNMQNKEVLQKKIFNLKIPMRLMLLVRYFLYLSIVNANG